MCIYGFHWNVDNCSVMEMIFAKYVHQIKNLKLQTCLRLLKVLFATFKRAKFLSEASVEKKKLFLAAQVL